MALPEIFQQFDRPDKNSPQFPAQLTGLLYKKGLKDYIPKSRDEDIVWPVEYLDSVSIYRTIPALCSVGIGSRFPRFSSLPSESAQVNLEAYAVLGKNPPPWYMPEGSLVTFDP